MRVRIRVTPREHELDGVSLDRLQAGTVREVSAAIGAWLIAEGYAAPEMRLDAREEIDFSDQVKRVRATVDDRRPRRRSTDR